MAASRALHRSCLLTVLGLMICGCRPTPQKPIVPAQSKDAPSYQTGSDDHLKLAISFIDSLNEYSEVEIVARIHHHLSKWIKESEPDDDWIADPLFGRLPKRLNLAKGRAALSRLIFQDADVAMLREALWLSQISYQVANRPVGDQALSQWLLAQTDSLGRDAVRDLGVSYELFDWVVRNIQTEPTTTTPDGHRYGKRMVWEAILLGRGDVWVKSRAFIMLARQQGVPAAMLAVDRDDKDAEEWLPAVLINGQLYLFDMLLGVPVPVEGESGIATLDQVVAEPAKLESLQIDGKYRVSTDELKQLVALIDATPEYLSQRMKLVEQALTSSDKMKLTCRPSVLSLELRQCKGITNVSLWPFPYDSIQVRMSLRKNPAALMEIQREAGFLSGQNAIARGRRQHFRGQLANEPTRSGAKQLYMDSRISNERIESLANAKEQLAAMLQNAKLPEDPQARAALAVNLQKRMRIAKEMASNWLGLLAFEKGQYSVAADFFDKRTVQAFPDGTSKQGALFNLGRTYERWGQGGEEDEVDQALLRKAIAAYESVEDESLQPACQIRAARLKSTL
jgi:tetratricopeptide (TPR) repeat protein